MACLAKGQNSQSWWHLCRALGLKNREQHTVVELVGERGGDSDECGGNSAASTLRSGGNPFGITHL